jgi:hypothetical protein
MNNFIILDIHKESDSDQVVFKVCQQEKNELKQTNVTVSLPFNTSLLEVKENWCNAHLSVYQSRGRKVKNQPTAKYSTQVILNNLRVKSEELDKELNRWLNHPELENFKQQLQQLLTQSGKETQVLIKADDFDLWCLPWQRWQLLTDYKVGLSYAQPKKIDRPVIYREKIRILAVLGDSEGINTQEDIRQLQALKDAEVEPLINPKRHQLYERLRDDQGWDILFFAGHSVTEGEEGKIFINDQKDTLTIAELKYTLKDAIGLGLKLAIFNSCDGLGLAKELASLHIPSLIVMSEPVPDKVAQQFLTDFLKLYSEGNSLGKSVQQAKINLQKMESDYPCASLLPIVCQNPLEIPYSWQELRGKKEIPTWRGSCLGMISLNANQRVKNNLLSREQLGYEIEEVFIPLGLVERRKETKDKEDSFLEVGFTSALPKREIVEVEVHYEQNGVF